MIQLDNWAVGQLDSAVGIKDNSPVRQCREKRGDFQSECRRHGRIQNPNFTQYVELIVNIRHSLVETTIMRGILLLTSIDKPVLLRNLFYYNSPQN